MEARDGQDTYEVIITATECSEEPNCVPQCTATECTFLCRHQISCTCLDYKQGHLCKHCHKVRAMCDASNAVDPTPALPVFSFSPEPYTKNREGLCHLATYQILHL